LAGLPLFAAAGALTGCTERPDPGAPSPRPAPGSTTPPASGPSVTPPAPEPTASSGSAGAPGSVACPGPGGGPVGELPIEGSGDDPPHVRPGGPGIAGVAASVSGNTLSVLGEHRGLQVLDVANPDRPRWLARVPI